MESSAFPFLAKVVLVAVMLAASEPCMGQTLRISKVSGQESGDVERMVTPGEKGGEQVFFVNKKIEISDKDVESAQPSISPPSGTLDVKLSQDGGNKFIELTKHLRPGVDRLALIVEGKLVAAPVVQSVPLGAQFQISGLNDRSPAQLDELARKMSGRPAAGPDEVKSMSLNDRPKFQYVPFTEEEYQARKTQREQTMGLFYLDRMPTEDELKASLKLGMSLAEVEKLYGKPYLGVGIQDPALDEFASMYKLAPEKRPQPVHGTGYPESFRVVFKGGKVIHWDISAWSSAPPEMRVVGVKSQGSSSLMLVLPKMDLSTGQFDPAALLQGIRIPEPDQAVATEDLRMLAQLAHAMSPPHEEGEIRIDCELMLFLARQFPEAAALRANAKEGKIQLSELHKAFEPYVDGSKPLPAPARAR